MGGGSKQAGPLGADAPADDQRGPTGLQAGANAAQALPPTIAEYKDTAEKKTYSYKGGKAQILLCRLATPTPDASWSLKKIRVDTKNNAQLGFTDCTFVSEVVSNPKAEAAGYFSARGALKTLKIRIPKELNITDAQIQAAEAKKDVPLTKKLKAFKACRDLLVTHELKHVAEAWAALSDVTLGYELKLGTLGESTDVTKDHMTKAVDDGIAKAPAAIEKSAKDWDNKDLDLLRQAFRGQHVFIDPGDDKEFLYVEPANP